MGTTDRKIAVRRHREWIGNLQRVDRERERTTLRALLERFVVRAAPGCEVMAIPGLLFGKHTELACLIFSPLDRLERKLRSKRG